MADFGSNFTDAFSAVYGARRQAKQQALDNARQEKMDAMTTETYNRQRENWKVQDARKKAVQDATSYRVPTGQNVTMVPGTYGSADEALAAYTQKTAAPANPTVDATGAPAQAGTQPSMQPAPNMPAQAIPMVGQPPVQPPVQVAPNAPTQALPTGGQPLATQPAAEATAQPATPITPKMVATQDLFGHWQVVPEAETREASQAEGLRAAAGALMRQGDVEGAYDLRSKASNLRKLDIEEDHATFVSAMDNVTRALASGDATQVGAAAKSVLGALNQAKDGIEYRYEPAPDGKGMQLQMYEQSTGLPAPGKPKPFPSIDPKTGLTADMQLVNYLKQFESADAFSNVFKENIAFADQVADRAAKDSKEKFEQQYRPLQLEGARQNIKQSQAAIHASDESTAASRAERNGVYSRKAYAADTKDFKTTVNSRAKELRDADPSLSFVDSVAKAKAEVLPGMPAQFQDQYALAAGVVDVPGGPAAPAASAGKPPEGPNPLAEAFVTGPSGKKSIYGIPVPDMGTKGRKAAAAPMPRRTAGF